MPDLPVINYTPIQLVAAMRQLQAPTSFLRDLFVNSTPPPTASKYLEISQVFGEDSAAHFVARDGDPNVVGRKGYDKRIHEYPYVNEESVFTPSDVDELGPEQNPYDPDAVGGFPGFVVEQLGKLDRRCAYAEERQIAEALQTGQLLVQGEGVDYTVDYGMAAANKIDVSVTAPWTGAADKLEQIRAWCAVARDAGAPDPDVMVMDVSSASLLLSDEDFLARLDNRRWEGQEIDFRQLRQQRATRVGRLSDVGLDLEIYTYQAKYTDTTSGSAVKTSYMHDNTLILGSTVADTRFHYGKIENFHSANFRGARFPHMYTTDSGKKHVISMESSPLFGLHQPDAFVNVIVAP